MHLPMHVSHHSDGWDNRAGFPRVKPGICIREFAQCNKHDLLLLDINSTTVHMTSSYSHQTFFFLYIKIHVRACRIECTAVSKTDDFHRASQFGV